MAADESQGCPAGLLASPLCVESLDIRSIARARSRGRSLLRPCSRGSPSAARMRSGTRTAAKSGTLSMHKQRSGASKLLEQVSIAPDATQALIHVRDYTKGHPRIEANNHPVRHDAVTGVHNGIILNDEEIFAEPRLRAAGARDDRRHRGDLRPRRRARSLQRGDGGASRLDGDGLARRARAGHRLHRARRRPAALARRGEARGVLRVDEGTRSRSWSATST